MTRIIITKGPVMTHAMRERIEREALRGHQFKDPRFTAPIRGI